ncbi:MAG: aminodeoxychorismate synthase component I [Rickettsiales bacterium]
MSWRLAERLGWREPLAFAAAHAQGDCALLYSSLRDAHSGQFSYLFAQPLQTIEGSDWAEIPGTAPNDSLPQWVGFLGYELGASEAKPASSPITFPDFRFTRYGQLWRFDHAQQHIDYFIAGQGSTPENTFLPVPSNYTPPKILSLESNFTRASYEAAVTRTVEAILAGDFYQANLTRKFFGKFETMPDPWVLFERLCTASPAPYSAFIRHGSQSILSSSPECFLSADAHGKIITRPIKGSAPRRADVVADDEIRKLLATSEKNHAENLMIVDLMRNDLSRVCEPGSVAVREQSGLYSYATIHHLISTIVGQKRPEVSVVEVLRACFPPGSMTGAPKIAAMRWCSEQERIARGVYSGAIGWLSHNACDFSVVIRTLLIDDNRFEFQVGGGIVADSTPEDEWRETLAKARGILAALGLDEATIARL